MQFRMNGFAVYLARMVCNYILNKRNKPNRHSHLYQFDKYVGHPISPEMVSYLIHCN